MRLVHYSSEPITKLHETVLRDPLKNMKPMGAFWVSVEDDDEGWADWCRSQECFLNTLRFVHEIALRKEANILYISNAAELRKFTQDYGTGNAPGYMSGRVMEIDWLRVSKKYQGIIITPYVWECRLSRETFWYYGWDCASGAIWDIEAIAILKLREYTDGDQLSSQRSY
jgi:hypothetical protein